MSNNTLYSIDQKDNKSSSGSEVDESPTLKPSKKTFDGTPIRPYSQGISENKAGMALNLSSNNMLKPMDSRKRTALSMPTTIQKRVKTDDVKEHIVHKDLPKESTHSHPKPAVDLKVKEEQRVLANAVPNEEEKKSKGTLVNYVRKKPWNEAKKYEMDVMIQMHSAFYENQREQFHSLRQTSNLIFLRKYNNWVKSVLINKTCFEKGKFLSVLDICCGKGGDLQKWFRNKINHYVGVDLSENSVKNAAERFKKMKFKGRLPFHAIFMVNDTGDDKNSFLNYLDKRILFDVVSCQMSMHYLCESEKRLRTFLSNVSSRLVPGGFYCGTTIDSNVLVRKLREVGLNDDSEEKYTFGNQFYSIKFLQKDFPKKQAFGLKYLFYLEDGVGK